MNAFMEYGLITVTLRRCRKVVKKFVSFGMFPPSTRRVLFRVYIRITRLLIALECLLTFIHVFNVIGSYMYEFMTYRFIMSTKYLSNLVLLVRFGILTEGVYIEKIRFLILIFRL